MQRNALKDHSWKSCKLKKGGLIYWESGSGGEIKALAKWHSQFLTVVWGMYDGHVALRTNWHDTAGICYGFMHLIFEVLMRQAILGMECAWDKWDTRWIMHFGSIHSAASNFTQTSICAGKATVWEPCNVKQWVRGVLKITTWSEAPKDTIDCWGYMPIRRRVKNYWPPSLLSLSPGNPYLFRNSFSIDNKY